MKVTEPKALVDFKDYLRAVTFEAELLHHIMVLSLAQKDVRVVFSDGTEVLGTMLPGGAILFPVVLTDEQVQELAEGKAKIILEERDGRGD